MSRLTLVAVFVLAASVVLTARIERHSRQQSAAQSHQFDQQTAQLAQLNADNARLSNNVPSVASPSALSGHDLVELLQLRNEATRLRELIASKPRLEAANAGLRDQAAKSQSELAAARALPNYWPKDQLTFAGYADPQSTLKSFFTAIRDGNIAAFTNCFDPALVPQFEAEMKRYGSDPSQSEANIKTWFSDFLSTADGFHIVNQASTSPDSVDITYSVDGAGRTGQFTFHKFGPDWKISN